MLFFSASVVAQKRLYRSYDSELVGAIHIDSNEIFGIRITAAHTDKIDIFTRIEGETYASTLLHSEVEAGVLHISTGKTPDYQPFNDKLSAHKVMSIELEIVVPQGIDLEVYSTLASLHTTGALGGVQVNLGRGHFTGEGFRFRESAHINTLTGSISVTVDQAQVSAQSRNGNVVIENGLASGAPLILKSLDGDIIVKKLN